MHCKQAPPEAGDLQIVFCLLTDGPQGEGDMERGIAVPLLQSIDFLSPLAVDCIAVGRGGISQCLAQLLDGSAGRNGHGTSAEIGEMGGQIDTEMFIDGRH